MKFNFEELEVWQRAIEYADLMIDVAENLNGSEDYKRLTDVFLQQICSKLLNGNQASQYAALAETANYIQSITGESVPREMAITKLIAHGDIFHFLYFAEDYIPKKISTEKKFYESEFLELLHQFHRPGGIIIDGGANIGNHTVYFAKVIAADVLAVEPEPHNASCLMLNIHLNEISERVIFCGNAVGETSGTVKLTMNIDSNFGTFSAKPNSVSIGDDPGEHLSAIVSVVCLDTVVKQACPNRDVSILKLDVEGMELEALRGAQQIIKSMLPVITVECFSNNYFNEIESELLKFGYFPIEVFNATPTFIFLSRENGFHQSCLIEYLQKKSIAGARKKEQFNIE